MAALTRPLLPDPKGLGFVIPEKASLTPVESYLILVTTLVVNSRVRVMVVDLLQQVGFNKYEAEAYPALLQHGPLTGYELGKRSTVPLSRSYEILERLTTKGLALVQPGDPPRYAAEAPEHFLGRTRTATLATLEALAQALADLTQPHIPEGFWVVRGREPILAHARALIATAQRTIAVSVAPT